MKRDTICEQRPPPLPHHRHRATYELIELALEVGVDLSQEQEKFIAEMRDRFDAEA